jgi:RNA polymerase sigma-70 factor (ECF subfamily)
VVLDKNPTTQSTPVINEEQIFSNLPDLYQAYATKVFHYHYSRVQNLHEAEDLTSQTFMAAWEKWHTLRDPDKAVGWLFTIARNKGIDHIRKQQRFQSEELDDELIQSTNTNDPQSSAETWEYLMDLRQHITKLSEKEQELIRLRLVGELPFKQVSQVMHEPETRIKKRYYRLLERLRAQMEQE